MALPAPLGPARGPEDGEAPGGLGIILRGIRLFQPTKGPLPWLDGAALAPLSQGTGMERTDSAAGRDRLAGLELGPHPGLCPLSRGTWPGAGGCKRSPRRFSDGPEEQDAAPGHTRPPAFQPPASRCTRNPHPHPLDSTPLPRRNPSPVSQADSVRAMKSCWAFLWEMKSSLMPDHLSPMKLLKLCNRGTSGAPLNHARRLRFSGIPLQRGQFLTLLHRPSNFSATFLETWMPVAPSPVPARTSPVGSRLLLPCPSCLPKSLPSPSLAERGFPAAGPCARRWDPFTAAHIQPRFIRPGLSL